jgi:hypothetical protein
VQRRAAREEDERRMMVKEEAVDVKCALNDQSHSKPNKTGFARAESK